MDDLLRLDDLRQPVEARVGNRHDTDVGIDGAERVVLRLDARLGKGIEQGGLADIGQSDDAAFYAHDKPINPGDAGWAKKCATCPSNR
jgi:hypothetical protein